MSAERTERRKAKAAESWTTRRLLGWMTGHFASKGIDSPRLVAEMLLSHVIGCERMRLYMEVDRPATPLELESLRDLVRRAARHEPAQYLVGETWFYGRRFFVDRSTLIPRPSTEALIEHVLQWHRAVPGHADALIADIGTGTGCIAVTLAALIPQARIVATDVSADALALAAENAQQHEVADRIEFRQGALLEPLEALGLGRFDVICSNPPYISDPEWEQVAPNVRNYEPASALRGGADGLDVIRPLIAEGERFLRPGGQLVVEIGHAQHDAVLELVKATAALTAPMVLKDHEGLWRVLVAEREE
ncbi:MAG: peptide chain release factor N(5)-glutamine methyltransferase [Planctomycetota bacterium]|jgi:release factor glutamine methyltransferase